MRILINTSVASSVTRQNITVTEHYKCKRTQSHTCVLFDVIGRPLTFIGRTIHEIEIGEEVTPYA